MVVRQKWQARSSHQSDFWLRNGSVLLVIANAGKPNGIAILPDQKKLYIANFGRSGISGSLPQEFEGPKPKMKGSLLEYSLHTDGNVTYKGMLIEFEDWGPDEIKVDSEGSLYLALDGVIGSIHLKVKK